MAAVGEVYANPFDEFFEERFRLMVMGYVAPRLPPPLSAKIAIGLVSSPPEAGPSPHDGAPPPELFNNEGMKHFVIPTRNAGDSTAEIRLVGEKGDIHYYLTMEDTVIAKGIPKMKPFTASPVKHRCSLSGCTPVRKRYDGSARNSNLCQAPGTSAVSPAPGTARRCDFDFSHEANFLSERYTSGAPLEGVIDLFHASNRNSIRGCWCHTHVDKRETIDSICRGAFWSGTTGRKGMLVSDI